MADGDVVVRTGVSPVAVVGGFVRSSVGAKVLMALSGVILWGFVIGHLVGNLQQFQGMEPMNAYGVFLRSIGHGAALWAVRAVLLAAFAVHVVTGIRLALLNKKARGAVGYAKQRTMASNFMAKTMALGGIAIFVFVLVHLAHFTWGWITPSTTTLEDAQGRHDVFRMVWFAFKNPAIVLFYVVMQAIVFMHLFHGTASMFQSLGLHHSTWTPAIRVAGRTIAALILLGNLAIPLAIFFFWTAP